MKTLHDYCKPKPITRERVREIVKKGESKVSVANRFDLEYWKVLYWTKGLETRKVYSSAIKEEVRRRIMNGERKITVSRDMDLNQSTVVSWTRDIKKNGVILGLNKTYLLFLNDLIEKGFVFGGDHKVDDIKRIYTMLREHLPVRRTRVRGKWIYYLEDRKEDAFRGFLERFGGGLISYRKLRMSSKAFGIMDNRKAEKIVRDERKGR